MCVIVDLATIYSWFFWFMETSMEGVSSFGDFVNVESGFLVKRQAALCFFWERERETEGEKEAGEGRSVSRYDVNENSSLGRSATLNWTINWSDAWLVFR